MYDFVFTRILGAVYNRRATYIGITFQSYPMDLDVSSRYCCINCQ